MVCYMIVLSAFCSLFAFSNGYMFVFLLTAPADENADEKRIRLAKKYLESVRDDLGGASAEPEQIASKLFSEVCYYLFCKPFNVVLLSYLFFYLFRLRGI